MARENGKKYSSSTLSGYNSEQEARDHISRNYQLVPVEVVRQGSDYVFYFEDQNGELYANVSVMKLEDPDGNAVVSIAQYECGGVYTIIYEYAGGKYRGGEFDGSGFMTFFCSSLDEVKRQIGGVLVGRYNQNN